MAVLREMQQRAELAKARVLRPSDFWDTLEADARQLKRDSEDWKTRLKLRLGIMSFCEGSVQAFGESEKE